MARRGSVNHLLNIFFKTGRFIAVFFVSKGNHLGEQNFFETVFDDRVKKKKQMLIIIAFHLV